LFPSSSKIKPYTCGEATEKPDSDVQGIAGRLGNTDSAMASGRLSLAIQVRLQILVRSHYSPKIHNKTPSTEEEEQQQQEQHPASP
jgi:hypothetical protein